MTGSPRFPGAERPRRRLWIDPEDARRVAYFNATRSPLAARDVPIGKCWAFLHHRTMAEVIAEESAAQAVARGMRETFGAGVVGRHWGRQA